MYKRMNGLMMQDARLLMQCVPNVPFQVSMCRVQLAYDVGDSTNSSSAHDCKKGLSTKQRDWPGSAHLPHILADRR